MNTAEIAAPLGTKIENAVSTLSFKNLLNHDMAMDLGTANTLIYMRGRGIVLNEPSVVAVDEETSKIVAIGREAKDMFGKTARSVRCVRPMKDGVIADFGMTSLMIRTMVARAQKRWALCKPRMIIGVPSGVTQVEKRAVIDAALCSGLREVRLVEEPMAAALGAELPVNRAVGNMIVDIGGGTTEVAIISRNETLYSHSIRVAGDEMDEAIQKQLRKVYGVQVGIVEAERVKLLIGSALPSGRQRTTSVCGRDLASGLPQRIEVSDDAVRESLQEAIEAIISSVVTALEQMTPEVARDVVSRGIFLAGGGSLLKGLNERLFRETGIKFHVSADPLSCVVRGVGRIVENLKEMQVLCIA